MADYEQFPRSDNTPSLLKSVSPVEMGDYPSLSHYQDETQTWLAFDRSTRCSSASLSSQPAIDVTEYAQPMILESISDRHEGLPPDESQSIYHPEKDTQDRNSITRKRPKVLDYSMWRSSSLLFGLIMLGLLFAVGHHMVFAFLDSKPVSSYSQTWVNRMSVGVALVVKMCCTLACGLAFQHTLWYSFRRNFIKVQSMDKLLDLRSNILGFLSFDCFRCAPFAMAIATIIWFLPVLPVVVPGALSVKGLKQSLPCTVRTMGEGGQNSTDVAQVVAENVLLSSHIAPFSSPCGPNCDYQLLFCGAGLTCEPYPNYVLSSNRNSTQLNTSAKVHDLPYDMVWPGSPDFLMQPEVPFYTAVQVDPNTANSAIWIQYLRNDSITSITMPEIIHDEPAQLDQAWETLACTLQNRTYSLNAAFENGVSAFNVTVVSFTPMNITGRNESIGESDHAQYLQSASALFSLLEGSISINTFENHISVPHVTGTQILSSSLVNLNMQEEGRKSTRRNESDSDPKVNDPFIWSVRSNFTTAIPDLLMNITLSMMAGNAPTYNTTCQSTQAGIFYQYKPKFLVLTYGLGLLATLCCLTAGLYALQDNEVVMDTTFSEMVAATRNSALGQALADEGQTIGARKSARYLKQRVMYGELMSGSSKSERRAAFGLQGQVSRLKKAL